MDCNSKSHDELKNMEESTCLFCDRLLVEVDEVVESCCGEQDMENVNGMNVCISCGLVHGYDYVTEYFNCYENMHKIRRKSVYHRNYHIDNVINDISFFFNLKSSSAVAMSLLQKLKLPILERTNVCYSCNLQKET